MDLNIIWILLAAGFMFLMIRGGGCCGGHGAMVERIAEMKVTPMKGIRTEVPRTAWKP